MISASYGTMPSFEAQQLFPNYTAYNTPMMSHYNTPISSFCGNTTPFYDVPSTSSTSNMLNRGQKTPSGSNSSSSGSPKLSPEELKKYREKRDRNNLAAKQSRKKRSQREQMLQEEVRVLKEVVNQLRQENHHWQQQDQMNKANIHQLTQELHDLRSIIPSEGTKTYC
ncbi:unnamed protein product [Auanema sp. JU1783]|nr:unnamed protein product [Auanema sp. JU1783]